MHIVFSAERSNTIRQKRSQLLETSMPVVAQIFWQAGNHAGEAVHVVGRKVFLRDAAGIACDPDRGDCLGSRPEFDQRGPAVQTFLQRCQSERTGSYTGIKEPVLKNTRT